jgi:hypothetical protein
MENTDEGRVNKTALRMIIEILIVSITLITADAKRKG